MIEIKEISIITTPLKQFIELNYYDFYNFLRDNGQFFIKPEYKKEGNAFYYFTFTEDLKNLVESYYQSKNFMIRYVQVYYPEFHNKDWRKTNNINEATL